MPVKPIVVCFPFVGDDFGGSHVSAIRLIEQLDRSLVSPIVALHTLDGPLAPYLARRGVPATSVPDMPVLSPSWRKGDAQSGGVWPYLTRSMPRMRRFLRERGVDIVHTNDGRIHASWTLAARAAGAKVLWHHRADPKARGVNMLAPLLADRIVAVSHFACPARPVRPLAGRLEVVHSPFDEPVAPPDRAAARAALVDELGCAPETAFLGFFGVFVDRKRPVAFVDAVHAYFRRHPERPVMGLLYGERALGGEPLDLAVTERAAALGIADRIRLMGFRDPVDPWMAATDVLLVPAVNEPFGRTLIEAQFLGTPVVATRHGGNLEAIEHGRTGYLVEPEQPDAFVDPVHRLLTVPELADSIREAARQEARRRYSSARHLAEITRIYRALAGRD